MKNAVSNIISLVMAFLVLFSTFSFTVDQHYCGDFLVDTAVFSRAESCGMEMKSSSNHDADLLAADCCHNNKVEVAGQNELKISFDSLEFGQQIFLSTFTYSYLNLFEGLPSEVTPFKDYSPPLLVADIQILDQVFLI